MHYKQTGRKSRESEHRVRNLQGREKKLVSEMVSGWEKKKNVNIKSGQLAFYSFFSSFFSSFFFFFLSGFGFFFFLLYLVLVMGLGAESGMGNILLSNSRRSPRGSM